MATPSESESFTRTFRFDVVDPRRKFQIPLLVAFVIALLIPVFLIFIAQLTGNLQTGREAGQERVDFGLKMLVIVVPIVFVAFGLPAWRKQPLVAMVSNTEITFRDRHWPWSQLDSILTLSDATKTTIVLHEADAIAFEISQDSSRLTEFLDLIKRQTEKVWFPRLIDNFRAGKVVQFGNLAISSQEIRQNAISVPLEDIGDYVVKDQLITLKRKNGQTAFMVAMLGLPNAHLLSRFLSNIVQAPKGQQ